MRGRPCSECSVVLAVEMAVVDLEAVEGLVEAAAMAKEGVMAVEDAHAVQAACARLKLAVVAKEGGATAALDRQESHQSSSQDMSEVKWRCAAAC